MLLTLVARSLAHFIVEADAAPTEPESPRLTLLDVPDYSIREFELRGLNVPASMLAGWGLTDLDRLRDRADKAGCPCLVLVEDVPLAFGEDDAAVRAASVQRVQALAHAAHRLGCNALAFACAGENTDPVFDRTASEIKAIMPAIERMELNVLLAPNAGLVFQPDRLTDLIKRIGGFRIGSLPNFGHAAETGDTVGTLRKLAPYAQAIHATVGGNGDLDLAACVEAIRSVGFVNTLAIDFVGKGDPRPAISAASEALRAAIEADS